MAIPARPNTFTVTAVGQGFRLQAATANNGGSAITHWEYKIANENSGLGGADWNRISQTGLSVDFTTADIGYGVTRHFRIRAVNADGNSNRANEQPSATTATVAPLKPTSFTVTASGQGLRLQAMVNPGGLTLTRWEYKLATSAAALSSASWTQISQTSTSLDFTTTDIGYGITRYVQVRAVNSDGDGATSDTVSGITATVAPLKPTSFAIEIAGQAFRLLASVNPGGTTLTRWEYKTAATSGGLTAASWIQIAQTSTSLDFTTPDFGYGEARHIQIRAVNSVGNGATSDTGYAVTMAALMTAPLEINIGRSSGSSQWSSFILGSPADKVAVFIPNVDINTLSYVNIVPHGTHTPTIDARWSTSLVPPDDMISFDTANELTTSVNMSIPLMARYILFQAVDGKSAGTVSVSSNSSVLHLSSADVVNLIPVTKTVELEIGEEYSVVASLSHNLELFRLTVESDDNDKVGVSRLTRISDTAVTYEVNRLAAGSTSVTLTAYPADNRTALTSVITVD